MAQTTRQQAQALWMRKHRATQRISRLILKLDKAWRVYQKLQTEGTKKKVKL